MASTGFNCNTAVPTREQATETRSQSAMGLSASGSLALETGEGNSLTPGGSQKGEHKERQSLQAGIIRP